MLLLHLANWFNAYSVTIDVKQWLWFVDTDHGYRHKLPLDIQIAVWNYACQIDMAIENLHNILSDTGPEYNDMILSRWYRVEIVREGNYRIATFGGISR